MPGIHRPFPLSREEKHPSGKGLKVRAAIRTVEQDGRYPVVTRGSHRQYKHPARPGGVTLSGKMSEDIAPGTLNSILKQARLKGDK